MAVDYSWLLECIDSESPGDATIQTGQTQATLFFIIKAQYLYKAFYDILGWCKFNDKDWGNGLKGGLDRRVEMSHPIYPAYTADSVDIVGVSADGKQAAENFTAPALEYADSIFQTSNPDPQVQVDYRTVPYFAVYKFYRIAVTFSAKPYFPLTNEQLEPTILQNQATPPSYNYWLRTPKFPYVPSRQMYYDFREMLRYCQIEVLPQNEIVATSNGKLYWKDIPPGQNFIQFPAPSVETPVTALNASTKFVNVTTNKIIVTWYKVPRTTLFNQQYSEAVGQVNYGSNSFQDPGDVETFNYELFNYAAGTLLLTGIDYDESSINSSFPILPYSALTRDQMINNNLKNQYINIKFNFLQRVIPQKSWIQPDLANIMYYDQGKMASYGGWNFVPNPNRLWYYAESASKVYKDTAVPLYWSFPMQRLFNPLAANVI